MPFELEKLLDLTPGVDKFPAHYVPVIRDGLNRDITGPGVTSDVHGATVVPFIGGRTFRLVTVSNDGGTAGAPDPSGSNCSFTYTLTSLSGSTLATTVTPEQARYPKTTYLAAGAAGRSTYGIAYRFEGTWLLLWLPGEIADATVCP